MTDLPFPAEAPVVPQATSPAVAARTLHHAGLAFSNPPRGAASLSMPVHTKTRAALPAGVSPIAPAGA